MKRREFLTAAASAGLAGAALPRLAAAAVQPCPPPTVKVGSGQPTPTSCNPPQWFSAIAPGTWGAIPSSVLNGSTAQVNGCLSGDWVANSQDVVTDWCGGFINTVGITAYPNNDFSGTATFMAGTFVCVWGGGHAGYQGNEMYCFGPLESASPQWYCPRPATSPAPSNAGNGFDSSGNPLAAHTYNAEVYVPTQNKLYITGLPFCFDAHSYSGVPVFDFSVANPASNQPWSAGPTAPSWPKCIGNAYDSVNNGIWGYDLFSTGYGLGFLNLATNTWSYSSGKWNSAAYYMGGAVDTKRGILAIYGSFYQAGQQLWFYRTNNGVNNTQYQPSTTGVAVPSGGGVGSVIYDPVADCFVLYAGGAAGSLLYTVTAPSSNPYQGGNAWTVASIAGSGSPTAEKSEGTFGRFGIITNAMIRGYTLINSVTASVYLYRP